MLIIACKDKRGVRHAVDMATQHTLCGKPDMGMGATGDRTLTCVACEDEFARRMGHASHIRPPHGFVFLARRMSRHAYHLVPVKQGKPSGPQLCGVTNESSANGSAMAYLLPFDADKRCTDCLRLATAPSRKTEGTEP